MSGRFDGKVVVVTGASRGIGGSIAVAFAREGANVVGVSRTESPEVKKEAGENFLTIPFDLSGATNRMLESMIGLVLAKFGKVDVLINNAGIIRRAPAVQFAEKDWDDVLRINLTVPFLLSQHVARFWIQTGRQRAGAGDRLRIVNIASLLSFQGGILVPAYAASKHGLAGLTKALANEWAGERINVNAVAPGYVETENTKALREDPARSASILSRIPQNAWAQPNDIAGASLFLASRDADYVNGAILNVDGGWLGR